MTRSPMRGSVRPRPRAGWRSDPRCAASDGCAGGRTTRGPRVFGQAPRMARGAREGSRIRRGRAVRRVLGGPAHLARARNSPKPRSLAADRGSKPTSRREPTIRSTAAGDGGPHAATRRAHSFGRAAAVAVRVRPPGDRSTDPHAPHAAGGARARRRCDRPSGPGVPRIHGQAPGPGQAEDQGRRHSLRAPRARRLAGSHASRARRDLRRLWASLGLRRGGTGGLARGGTPPGRRGRPRRTPGSRSARTGRVDGLHRRAGPRSGSRRHAGASGIPRRHPVGRGGHRAGRVGPRGGHASRRDRTLRARRRHPIRPRGPTATRTRQLDGRGQLYHVLVQQTGAWGAILGYVSAFAGCVAPPRRSSCCNRSTPRTSMPTNRIGRCGPICSSEPAMMRRREPPGTARSSSRWTARHNAGCSPRPAGNRCPAGRRSKPRSHAGISGCECRRGLPPQLALPRSSSRAHASGTNLMHASPRWARARLSALNASSR